MREEVHEKARSGLGPWTGLLHHDAERLCFQVGPLTQGASFPDHCRSSEPVEERIMWLNA